MRHPSLPIRTAVTALALSALFAAAAYAAAPVARDDHAVATDRYLETVNGVEQYSILIDVLANDEDADGHPLEVIVQGDFGGPPEIWQPQPVGFVQYLGAGVFDLTFGKEELGSATKVTFQYELEGAAAAATVTVTVAGEGPPPEVIARGDSYQKQGNCWLRMDVLANDSGADVIAGFTQPDGSGLVERHPADPNVLVLRGSGGGTFTYVAKNSVTSKTAEATVEINGLSTLAVTGKIVMSDCFQRADGTDLNGQRVAYTPVLEPGRTWTSAGLTHLAETVTVDRSLDGSSNQRRKAYAAFDADGRLASEGATAFEIAGTFRADPTSAEWVAIAFTHGSGSVFAESDLWLRLDTATGELSLNGRWGGGLQEKLRHASPASGGYTFVQGGVNHLRLRYDVRPAVPRVDAWINGVRVFTRIASTDSGDDLVDVSGTIENAGYFINYGANSSDPSDIWFDDFEVWVGTVDEAILKTKSDDPNVGADVENGSTLSMDPLHLGCTADHVGCHSTRTRSIWLTNGGNEDLYVDNLRLDGEREWILSPTGPSFTIPPGGEQQIEVRVDALETGSTDSRLELTTNDEDLGKLVVYFTADVTQAPVANLVHYCDGLTCSFDGGSSTGSGLSYEWLVNGVKLGTSSTFDHAFAASGIYTVELRVTDSTGAQHRLQRTVSIPPEASFTYTCFELSCDFDAATATPGVGSYRYDFGDGQAHAANGDPGAVVIQHTYATSGRYDVTLVVVDGAGQEDRVTHEVVLAPMPDFSVVCSADTLVCDFDALGTTPQMTSYEWQLGDGRTGFGAQTSHTYATSGVYTATLLVVDQSGQVATVSKPVTIPPRARFSLVCDPSLLSCSLDGSASTPGVTHAWSFGDGSPQESGATQEHTYATSGIFAVTLTVTDSSGQTASASDDAVLPPTADFSFECDALLCTFDASASSPGVSQYSWDFGHSGGTDTGVAPIHEFPDGGVFTVVLTVTDGSAQTDTASRTLDLFDEELFLLIILDE